MHRCKRRVCKRKTLSGQPKATTGTTLPTCVYFSHIVRSETSRKRVKSPLIISMRISRFRSNLIDMIAIVKLRNSVNFQTRNEHFSVARL